MRSCSIVKAKQNWEVREIWGHLCCWCNYTQVHTSLSLNHIIHTCFPKVKRTHQALGSGKREFKKKKKKNAPSVPGNHSRSLKHTHGNPAAFTGTPSFQPNEHCPRTLKTPQPFPSESLTLLLIPLQRDTFPRRLEKAHNSTAVQHGSREPSDGRRLAGTPGSPDAASQQNTDGIRRPSLRV